jgi:CheY-like chemotaxis protein
MYILVLYGEAMRILYVEDDSDDREVFQQAVAKTAPYTVCHFAEDGEDAIRMLSDVSNIPDYIFLDINLPKMNGIRFLKVIKNSNGLKGIPVVVFSTSQNPLDRLQSLDLGAVDFISKPDKFSQYCEVLKRFI